MTMVGLLVTLHGIFLAFALNPMCIEYGMDKVIQAYDMACAYGETNCNGLQAEKKMQVLALPDIKDNPQRQMFTFAAWSGDALNALPDTYVKACKQYLRKPFAEPNTDEGNELEDAGKRYCFQAYAYCLVHTLRQVSEGKMKRDLSMLYIGMEKTIQAYDMVCNYTASHCDGLQAEKKEQVLNRSDLVNNPYQQMITFKQWSFDAVKDLPKTYEEQCAEFLSQPWAILKFDESKVLLDQEIEYPFKAYAHCLVHVLREKSNGSMSRDWSSETSFGIEKTLHALEIVCEYEKNHNKRCSGGVRENYVLYVTLDPFKNDSRFLAKYFCDWVSQNAMKKIPHVYQNCNSSLNDPLADVSTHEEETLEDFGINYPYKAFAHCLIGTLRIECGGTLPKEVVEIKTRIKADADAPEDYD